MEFRKMDDDHDPICKLARDRDIPVADSFWYLAKLIQLCKV